MAQEYVCGFAFDGTLTSVLLILKQKGPIGMAGMLNGIGGKIELGESPVGAMRREFLEEVSGFDDNPPEWHHFHRMRHFDGEMRGNGATVHFYAAHCRDQEYWKAKPREQERVIPVSVHALLGGNCTPKPVYNLRYLIPMAHVYLSNPQLRWLEG